MSEPSDTRVTRTHARLLPPALFIATAVTFVAFVAYRIYGALHGNP